MELPPNETFQHVLCHEFEMKPSRGYLNVYKTTYRQEPNRDSLVVGIGATYGHAIYLGRIFYEELRNYSFGMARLHYGSTKWFPLLGAIKSIEAHWQLLYCAKYSGTTLCLNLAKKNT